MNHDPIKHYNKNNLITLINII